MTIHSCSCLCFGTPISSKVFGPAFAGLAGVAGLGVLAALEGIAPDEGVAADEGVPATLLPPP